jgi:hypothetical protein
MSACETARTLVDRILPDVVDALREAAAVARAAEAERATKGDGSAFALLLEQEATLQGAIALLRAMRYAHDAGPASGPTRPAFKARPLAARTRKH